MPVLALVLPVRSPNSKLLLRSSSSEKAKKVPAGSFGDIVNKFDRSMAPSNVPAGAFGDIVNKFDNAMNPSSETKIKFELPTFTATGTDTGSGDREVLREEPRVAQTDDMDANMRAWAAANPTLAKRMVDKVDARRNKGLEGKQSGYETVRDTVYPERKVLAAEGNLGGFSVDDAVDGGMSSKEAEAIASGGFVETVFDKGVQGESKITKNSAGEAQDLLKNYQAQLSGNLSPLVEDGIPSESQNPRIANTDYTPIDSEIELSKAVPNFAGKMDGLNKNMSNRFRAF